MNPLYDEVPYDSFMGHYLRFMSTQETAHTYDWWCGLWTIACACGRATRVARPRAPVYLNMYLVLVGDSGVPRKSTSINTAAKLITDLYEGDDLVGIIGTRITAELIDSMLTKRTKEHGNAQLVITIPELATFAGQEGYLIAVPALLTDLYDCPDTRIGGGTLKRGEAIQHNVWVSFLSGSTQVWLLQTVNQRMTEGGFTSRCLFVVSNTPKQSIPWPDETDTAFERSQLMDELRAIKRQASMCPEIHIIPTALDMFREWYNTRTRSVDPYKQAFEAREDSHVLRVAALLSINDRSWEIKPRHLRVAIKLMAEMKESSSTVFEIGVMRSKYAASFDIIRTQLLGSHDPVPRSKVVQKCRYFLQMEELNVLIETMINMGLIRRFIYYPEQRTSLGGGMKRVYFHGTDKLIEKGIGEKVLEHFS